MSILGAAPWLAGPAAAQVAAPPESGATAAARAEEDLGKLGDIVVTARRTEERLQRTPVAVTAVGAADLARAQVVSVADVQRTAPNVSIATGSPSSSTIAVISIRGQTNINAAFVNDPAIALYQDGVYIGRAAGALLDLDDVARVEVLRGPQGTLFGRNTTGGAISIVSNQPDATGLQGAVSARAGNYALREGSVMLNLPVVADTLAVRGFFKHMEHDGYGRNFVTGLRVGDDNVESWRVQLRYAPAGSDWDITLASDGSDRRNRGSLAVLGAVNPASAVANYIAANPPAGDSIATYLADRADWWRTGTSPTQFAATNRGYGATINGRLGPVRVLSITAWRELNYDAFIDADGTPYTLLGVEEHASQDQLQQELKLSATAGPVDPVGGFFYFRENSHQQQLQQNYFVGGAAGAQLNNNVFPHNASSALYGQFIYRLSDQLRFTGGLRYTWDDRKVVLRNTRNRARPDTGFSDALNTVRNCNNGTPNNGATALGQNDGPNDPSQLCRLTLDAKFDYLSFLASADYQISPGALVYVKSSRAFLAGGWNFRGGSPARAFGPEGVTDVELGAKIDWLGGRLRTNLAVFHSWQSDLQRSAVTLDPVTQQAASYLVNAGSGHVNGAEIEITAVPWTGMTLNASGGVTDAHYDRFSDLVDSSPDPGLQPLDRTGENYPGVPSFTWSAGATQRYRADYGEWAFHADYAVTGPQYFFAATPNPLTAAAAQQGAIGANAAAKSGRHGLLNGQVSLDLANPHITLAIWGRNITNTKYITRTFADTYTTLGFSALYLGDPRTVGVSATVRF